MTQAQKTAKAKFKQAIAYRQKTGVSLKEAFAHIYGKKKVGVVKKKPYKGYQYTIDENETGNFVDKYYTLTEAKKDLNRLIAKSKKSGKYKKDFYRITQINSGKTIFGIKKKAAKKVVKKKYGLNPKKDKLYEAKKPGKRKSASGKTYYESRENRSDKGKMYGVVKAKPTIISLAKKIARQTDLNEHNLAILSLAKFLKAKKAIELMNNVIKMHDNFGYMPKNLIDIRDEIYDTLMMLLKSKYGDIDYKTIQNSF